MVRLVDLDHRWAHEIGRVFIAFGSIEYTVHSLLEVVPRDPIHRTTAGLRLGQKLEMLVEILDVRDGAKEAALAALLRRVKPLAEDRNLIAHNPLALDIYLSEAGEPMSHESIRHMRNSTKHMSFQDVEKLRQAAEELAFALLNAQLEMAPGSRGTS